jgi:hypothetical protein
MQYLVPAIRVKNAKNKGQCKMAYSKIANFADAP